MENGRQLSGMNMFKTCVISEKATPVISAQGGITKQPLWVSLVMETATPAEAVHACERSCLKGKVGAVRNDTLHWPYLYKHTQEYEQASRKCPSHNYNITPWQLIASLFLQTLLVLVITQKSRTEFANTVGVMSISELNFIKSLWHFLVLFLS